jgi:GNAT superfamily N-acetyltransferase
MNHTLARTRGTQEEAEVNGPVHERARQPRAQGPRIETQVFIRDASSTDGESLRRMFSHVSPETVYLRFHIPYPNVPEWMLSLMLHADQHDKQSLVAVAGEEIVGHAMYVRLGDGGEAEMAIIVDDGWQSKGVGKLLLRNLAEVARRRGVEIFVGTVLIENRRMLGLIDAVFTNHGSMRVMGDGGYHVRMPLRTFELADPVRILPRIA